MSPTLQAAQWAGSQSAGWNWHSYAAQRHTSQQLLKAQLVGPQWGMDCLYLIISMSLPFREVNTMHSLITRVFSCRMGVGTARGRC